MSYILSILTDFLFSFCDLSPPPVPTPPTFFTKVLNDSAVQVLWELPSKAGKAEGFRLSYRKVPHGDFQGPLQMACGTNAHTIARLGETPLHYMKAV